MLSRWKMFVRNIPFTDRYLPVSQNDILNSCESLRSPSESSSSEYGAREKILSSVAKPTSFHTAKRLLPWVICCCLIVSNIRSWMKLRAVIFEDAVYSPVDIAAYGWKNVNFAAATQDELTEYQGVPNERNNQLWTDSFNLFGISKITMEEARPLKNRTVPMDDEGNYIVTLDVFHQLHCLNKLREKIYWNTTNYGEPEHLHLNMVHIDHCIDQLRQSLMCTVDVTPIPYEWYAKYGAYMPSTGIMHTCRNFEAVQEWAKKRPAGKWDTKKYRVDPLGDQVHVYKEWWCKENGGCEGPQDLDAGMDGTHHHAGHHG